MTWIVTNGKSGDDAEYIEINDGGLYWVKSDDEKDPLKRRARALALALKRDADSVRAGIPGAVVVAVVDEVLV